MYMRNKKTFIIVSFLIVLISVAIFYFLPLKKTINVHGAIASKTTHDLMVDSDVVIKGTVKEILPSRWSNPESIKGKNVRNIIQTDISVNIDQILKGNPYDYKNIIVRINKGTVKNVEYISEGYPDFKAGEEVVLFLSIDDGDLSKVNTNENYYVLTGMLQGKFTLSNKTTNDEEFTCSSLNITDKLKLSTLKNNINKAMEEEKLNPRKKLTPEEIKVQNEKLLGK